MESFLYERHYGHCLRDVVQQRIQPAYHCKFDEYRPSLLSTVTDVQSQSAVEERREVGF